MNLDNYDRDLRFHYERKNCVEVDAVDGPVDCIQRHGGTGVKTDENWYIFCTF